VSKPQIGPFRLSRQGRPPATIPKWFSVSQDTLPPASVDLVVNQDEALPWFSLGRMTIAPFMPALVQVAAVVRRSSLGISAKSILEMATSARREALRRKRHCAANGNVIALFQRSVLGRRTTSYRCPPLKTEPRCLSLRGRLDVNLLSFRVPAFSCETSEAESNCSVQSRCPCLPVVRSSHQHRPSE
jgi:hypothetical protein